MNVAEIIRKAKRPERTVDLFLGDERVAEYEQLEHQLESARSTDSLDGGPARAIAQQMRDLEAAMSESRVTVRLRAMSRVAHARLLGEHPPRRGEDGEFVAADQLGYNAETYWPALIRASWVEPQLAAADLDYLLDEVLTAGQFDAVAKEALVVNRGRVDVPFSPAASTLLRTSEPE
jgi:hypothetical protein